jgi:uncharacterized membrane protein
MSPRLRKLIGSLAVLVFLTGYIVLAVTLADHIPDNRAAQLLYFVVAGVAWGLPILPLFVWMETGAFRRARPSARGRNQG